MNNLTSTSFDSYKHTLNDFYVMRNEKQTINFKGIIQKLVRAYYSMQFSSLNPQSYQNKQIKKYEQNVLLIRSKLRDCKIEEDRLDYLQQCINIIIENNIDGDFIEVGAWRGGAGKFMRELLKDLKITNRNIYSAASYHAFITSFNWKYKYDKLIKNLQIKRLARLLNKIEYFEGYDWEIDTLSAIQGWFHDTLPTEPIEKIALLRLDGDTYKATMGSLVNLYPKLSSGGIIIIDDWNAVAGCKKAVIDFRNKNRITEDFHEIDPLSIFWKKGSSVTRLNENKWRALEYSYAY